jgi:hypothetical protein
MEKYLVISYDPDQQQWFYDVVFAVSKEAAKERLLGLREYAIDADVFDMGELVNMGDNVQSATLAETEAWLHELYNESQR